MADFKIGVGVDYAELLTGLNKVKSNTLNFFDNMSKKTVLKVHTELDSKALDTAFAKYQSELQKFNAQNDKSIINIMGRDLKKKLGKMDVIDFRSPAKDMLEIENRAKTLHKILEGINQKQGRISLTGKGKKTMDPAELRYIQSLYDGYMSIIRAKQTYDQMASSAFLGKRTGNTFGLIDKYGNDENGLRRKKQLWEQLRGEYIKYEKQTGISQTQNIKMIDAEISELDQLIQKHRQAASALGKYEKRNKKLVDKFNIAEQNDDLQKQIALLRQLEDLNQSRYSETRDSKYKDTANIYHQQIDALTKKAAMQKADEANQRKILQLEEKRNELTRRVTPLVGSEKREDLMELSRLYQELAKNEQKAFELSQDAARRDNADKYRQQARAMREAAKEHMKTATIQQKLNAVKNLQGGIFKGTQDINELRTNIQLLERIRSLQKDLIGAGKPQDINATIRELSRYRDQLNKLTGRNNSLLNNQGGILRNLISYAKSYVSVWGAFNIAKRIAETTGEFEKQKTALKSIIQDAAVATELFNKLKSYSLQTPMTFNELLSTTKKLTAYQIPVEDLFDTTKRLSDLSAGLGVDVDRLVLAFGQIRAASVLRGQEVRQLTEAGIPIINELAKSFERLEGRAVSTAEVFKRISQRGVSFEMVRDILWDMTDEGGKFFNMQEQLMNTDVYGPMMKMKDAWSQALDEMGRTTMSGPLHAALNAILGVIRNWRVALWSIAGLLTGKVAVGAAGLIQKFKELKATMTLTSLTNVFAAISTAIGLIAGYFINATAKAREFKNAIRDINLEYNKKATGLIDNFEKLVDSLNASTEGSKAEEIAIRKLQNAYSDILPQQDLTIERLRDQKKGYDDLTAAIAANIEEQRRAALVEQINGQAKTVIDSTITKELAKKSHAGGVTSGLYDPNDTFKDYLKAYLLQNAKTMSVDDMAKHAIKIYDSFYQGRTLTESNQSDIKMTIARVQKELKPLFDTLDTDEIIHLISDSNALLTRQQAEAIINAKNAYNAARESNRDKAGSAGEGLAHYNNASLAEYVHALIVAYSGKEYTTMNEESLQQGTLGGEDILEYLRGFMYAKGGGESQDFSAMSPYSRGKIQALERELAEQFPNLSETAKQINAVVTRFMQENQGDQNMSEHSPVTIKNTDTLLSYQDTIKKNYQAITGQLDQQTDKNTDLAKSLQKQKQAWEGIAEIAGLNLTDTNLSNLRKKFDMIKEAFTAEQNAMKYVSESLAIKGLRGTGFTDYNGNDIFETNDQSVNWVNLLNEVITETEKLDMNAADTMNDNMESIFKTERAQEIIDQYKHGIEDIDKKFSKMNNAKEFFRSFVEAGMSWTDAMDAAKRIAGAVEIAKNSSALVIEQIGELLSKNGFDNVNLDELTTNEGISALQETLLGKREIDYGEGQNSQTGNVSEYVANKILQLLENLRKILADEQILASSVDDLKYSRRGLSEREGLAVENLKQAITEAASSDDVLKMLEKANSYQDRTTKFGFKRTYNAQSLNQILTKQQLDKNATTSFKKIAEKMPDGDKIIKEFAKYQNSNNKNKKALEKAITASQRKEIIQSVAERLPQYSSMANTYGGLASEMMTLFGSSSASAAMPSIITGSLNDVISKMSEAMKAITDGDSLAAIDGIGQALAASVKAINDVVAAIEDIRTTKLQNKIKEIELEVNSLERKQDELYGTEYLENSLAVIDEMQAKADILKEQADDYEDKSGSSAKEKYLDYQEEYLSTIDEINNKVKELADYTFGSVDDWSSRLSDSLKNAFENGTNAARAWRDTVEDYINDLITQSMTDEFLKPAVETILDQFKNDYTKEVGTNGDKKTLPEYLKEHKDDLTSAMQDLFNSDGMKAYLDWLGETSSTASASGNSMQSLTEDTGNRLLALGTQSLIKMISLDTNLLSVLTNTTNIRSDIARTQTLISSFHSMMDNHQRDIYNLMYDATTGAKKFQVAMS